jgi:hypothetical protein
MTLSIIQSPVRLLSHFGVRDNVEKSANAATFDSRRC